MLADADVQPRRFLSRRGHDLLQFTENIVAHSVLTPAEPSNASLPSGGDYSIDTSNPGRHLRSSVTPAVVTRVRLSCRSFSVEQPLSDVIPASVIGKSQRHKVLSFGRRAKSGSAASVIGTSMRVKHPKFGQLGTSSLAPSSVRPQWCKSSCRSRLSRDKQGTHESVRWARVIRRYSRFGQSTMCSS